MYRWILVKRKLESFVLLPFILIGWLISRISKKQEYSVYFFFPFYHIGGAEKVHYQIAQAFADKKCVIYFTRTSKGTLLLNEFQKSGLVIKDISKYTDNKLFYPLNFIFRGIISGKINQQRFHTVVFNGQSNFGYKISPWIKKTVTQIDLIHALNTFSKIRLPFLEFYKRSVTVSQEIIDKHKELYKKYEVPTGIIDNITYINYGIELPISMKRKIAENGLNILYVGRGSEEKRVHLIAEIAEEVHKIDTSIKFSFLGDVENFIPKDLKKYCTLLGSTTDSTELDKVYRSNDVLIVTSSTESGPLVVMEAMARGLCILSTPVGIVNEHIQNGRNGYVFSSITKEKMIIEEAKQYILELKDNAALRGTISKYNTSYAYANFGIQKFQAGYRKLLNL